MDIAKLAGVSKTTVSKVLNHQYGVHEDTRKKVWDAAAELHYTPNIAARTLVTSKTGVIGVVYDSFSSPIYMELAGKLEHFAAEKGYHLVFCSCNARQEAKQHYIQYFMGGAADGVIIFGSAKDDLPVIQRLMALQFPFVVIENHFEELEIPNVLVDNQAGARQAVHYLHRLGHRSIVHVTGNMEHRVAMDRQAGFREAMEALGLDTDSDAFISTDGSNGCGVGAAQQLMGMNKKPTAVFAFNDLIAYEMMDTLHQAGYRIPEDISIVGFDHLAGVLSFKPGLHDLTSIAQPLSAVAEAAVEIVAAAAAGEEGISRFRLFTPELKEGHTCARVQRQ